MSGRRGRRTGSGRSGFDASGRDQPGYAGDWFRDPPARLPNPPPEAEPAPTLADRIGNRAMTQLQLLKAEMEKQAQHEARRTALSAQGTAQAARAAPRSAGPTTVSDRRGPRSPLPDAMPDAVADESFAQLFDPQQSAEESFAELLGKSPLDWREFKS